MTTVMSVKEGLKAIEKDAAESDKATRVIKEIAIGKAIRQGDIYLTRVAADHQLGAAMETNKLVPDDNAGSQHLVEGAKLFKPANPAKERTVLLGPVVVADKPFALTHPEHAHFHLPAGVYQTTYQLDVRTMERMRD